MSRWEFRNASFWQLQALGWSCFYMWDLIGSIPALIAEPRDLLGHTASDFFIFLGSCALRPYCRFLVRRQCSLLRYETALIPIAVVIAGVTALITAYLFFGHTLPSWSAFLPLHMEYTFTLFVWGTLYFTVKQWREFASERERLLRAESESREARLQALRYQLNPHFLFNSLNAVSTLVLDKKSEAATQMLAQIGDFLREILDPRVRTEVPLAQDLLFTDAYLSIEKTRLGDRLQLEMDIAPETLDALVPSMMLQPMVENAIRYGVNPMRDGAKIILVSTIREDRLHITIFNSGPATPQRQVQAGCGIGMRNTAERLQTLYGSEQEFLMEFPEAGGCRVTIELPFRSSIETRGDAHAGTDHR
jgi:two-component system, LytTR family, sensor kinase